MIWKRISFGITSRESADKQFREMKKDWPGKKLKINHGKMGYSILLWAPSFKKK
jgi:hypothetical protein